VPERLKPAVYTIPPHRAFADALAVGLLAQHGKDKLVMARGMILVPNNRAATAIQDAFVRQADGGLLLPRLVAIGDDELDYAIGAALDPIDDDPIPPAIDPLERQLRLARLIQQERAVMRDPVDIAEAMRLAADLGRTLDQLIYEGVSPQDLRRLDLTEDLSRHWQTSLDQLSVILDRWPEELTKIGRIDQAERRNRVLSRIASRWLDAPPSGFIVAAGISTTAKAVAALLRVVARLPIGAVVFSGLDTEMPAEEWATIIGDEAHPAIETHPQYHFAQLLDGMGVNRAEVDRWRWGGGHDARAVRSRAISNALAPSTYTGKWNDAGTETRLAGVKAAEFDTAAEEAQGIAIALREAMEIKEQTAALVTPDRALAQRIAAHLKRWGIDADDSAGRALSTTPSGTFLLALATAAAERFAPVPLLALLKHPLAQTGDARLQWLDGARALDLALRGPRPAAGLEGVSGFLAGGDGRVRKIRDAAAAWWRDVAPKLEPLEAELGGTRSSLPSLIGLMTETGTALCGDALWSGTAGRAAADLFAALERMAEHAAPAYGRHRHPPAAGRPSPHRDMGLAGGQVAIGGCDDPRRTE
jgi:ATP-dependent helicase/nuclease subunit B